MRQVSLGRRVAALLALMPLVGCAVPYDPVVMDVADPAVLAADRAECTRIADTAGRHFNAATVGSDIVSGAADASDLSAINPLSVAAGAGQGLLTGLFEWLGLIDDNRHAVFQACLSRRGDQHGYGVLGLR